MPTPPPAIDTPPLAPDPSNRGTFNLLAYNWSMSLAPLSGQFAAAAANVYANAQEAVAAAQTAILAPGTHATSATSLTIGTGSKVLSIQTGKQFSVGQFVIVASTVGPQNYLFGQITAHDSVSGSMTVNAVSVGGSGTFASWTVSLTSPWNAAAQISFSPSGGVAETSVQDAIAGLDSKKFAKSGGQINAASATSPLTRGVVTVFGNFGDGATPSIAASAFGSAQGQKAGVAYFPTFVGTGDNRPRRAADIWASFGGIWGTEKLSFGVGRDGSSNDTDIATVEKLAISGGSGASTALFVNSCAFGYGSGAGGSVVQATSKSTAVSLNKPAGQIATHAAALAAGASVIFVCNNSFVGTNDAIPCSINVFSANATSYRIEAFQGTGTITFRLTNVSGVSLSDSVVLNFVVIKGAAS